MDVETYCGEAQAYRRMHRGEKTSAKSCRYQRGQPTLYVETRCTNLVSLLSKIYDRNQYWILRRSDWLHIWDYTRNLENTICWFTPGSLCLPAFKFACRLAYSCASHYIFSSTIFSESIFWKFCTMGQTEFWCKSTHIEYIKNANKNYISHNRWSLRKENITAKQQVSRTYENNPDDKLSAQPWKDNAPVQFTRYVRRKQH